ncbi:MAG: hypothetical protein ABWY08_09690 [Comamonas sp.]
MTEAAQTRRRLGQAVIGIVDDNESVRLALATLLRSIGIASRTFASGPGLPGSELPAHFSCRITDPRLRSRRRLQAPRAIRQRGGDPAIIISACDELETRQRGAFVLVDKRFADLSLMGVVLDAWDAGHGAPARPAQ